MEIYEWKYIMSTDEILCQRCVIEDLCKTKEMQLNWVIF